MENHTSKHKSYLFQSLLLITLFFASCSPSAKGIRQNKKTVVEAELTPTISDYDVLPDTEKEKYEPPVETITNNNTTIHLKGLKILKSQKKYSLATGVFTTTAQLEIYDLKTKSVVAQSDFTLSGSHSPQIGTMTLKAVRNSNSNIKIAAQVTCLETTEEGDFDCSEALVEFVAQYENKYYAQQTQSLNLVQKKSQPVITTTKKLNSRHLPVLPEDPAISPVKTVTTPVLNIVSQTSAANVNDDEIIVDDIESADDVSVSQDSEQVEGDEKSLNLNPIGQLSLIDLTTIFDSAESTEPKKDSAASATVTSEKDTASGTAINKEKDKPAVNAAVKQNDKSKLIKYNQSIKLPENGRLRNASSLLEQYKTMNHQNFYKLGDPTNKKYFGTQEIIDLVAITGEKMFEETGRKIFISNLSKQNGGPVAPHKSHQNGVDIDIAYPSRNNNIDFPNVVRMKPRVFNKKLYSTEKTLNLLKIIFEQKNVPIDRIFMDRAIKADLCTFAKSIPGLTLEQKSLAKKIFSSINHVDGHGNHMHLRIKCTENQPACIPKAYLKTDSCF